MNELPKSKCLPIAQSLRSILSDLTHHPWKVSAFLEVVVSWGEIGNKHFLIKH